MNNILIYMEDNLIKININCVIEFNNTCICKAM